jgi:hypothetical protein
MIVPEQLKLVVEDLGAYVALQTALGRVGTRPLMGDGQFRRRGQRGVLAPIADAF